MECGGTHSIQNQNCWLVYFHWATWKRMRRARRVMALWRLSSIFVFLEGDALVEGLGAFVTCWQEMETDTTDVLLCLEVLKIVNLLTFNLQFHHAPVFQAHTIALTKMIINNLSQT